MKQASRPRKKTKTNPRHFLRLLLPVMLYLLLFITVAVTAGTMRMIQKELRDKLLSITYQARSNLDYRFEQHEEIANGIMLSVSNYLNTTNQLRSQDYAEFTAISSQLTAYLTRGMISDIVLYVPDNKMYSSQRDMFYPLSSFLGNDRYKGFTRSGIHWMETEFIRFSPDSNETPAIACIFVSSHQADYSNLAGALFLYISVDKLNNVFTVNSEANEEIFLVNSAGTVLAHTNASNIGNTIFTEEEHIFLQSSESGCKILNSSFMTFSKLETVDWYLVVRVPREDMWQFNSAGIILLASLWLITLLVLGFVCVIYIHNAIVGKAIQSMQSLVYRFDSANEVQSSSPKPVQRRFLSNARLQMEAEKTVQVISDSVKKLYQEQLEMANYQMQSLQAQIKPHFLYNTLDIIKWMIVEGNYSDSIWMINALSKYLRMSISRDSGLVTLREEIELAKTYLDIIQKRFSKRFETVIEADDSALECMLPRLMLQPLVENALIHGLLYCSKPDARIEIRAWTQDSSLFIDIEDNGNGMPPDTLSALRNGQHQSASGYGLQNIRTRLKLFSGSQGSMEIYSQLNMGTCVSIRLPIQRSGPAIQQNDN